ncbi:MAG: c-type cytochrome [Pseudomonadota bacterium]
MADFDASGYPPYERCAICHGLFGVSHTDRFPHLGGQKPGYIEAQIDAFMEGRRTNDRGQMAAIVTELKPEEVSVVVEWFSTQDPPAPSGEGSAKGKSVFADLGCAACHGADMPEVPHLTAQHAGYLAKQMTDFRDGARAGHPAARLHTELLELPDDTLAAVADYLAAEVRP